MRMEHRSMLGAVCPQRSVIGHGAGVLGAFLWGKRRLQVTQYTARATVVREIVVRAIVVRAGVVRAVVVRATVLRVMVVRAVVVRAIVVRAIVVRVLIVRAMAARSTVVRAVVVRAMVVRAAVVRAVVVRVLWFGYWLFGYWLLGQWLLLGVSLNQCLSVWFSLWQALCKVSVLRQGGRACSFQNIHRGVGPARFLWRLGAEVD
ncbi:hypothetical protein COCON_G00230910 [Conger conger]|uniref:Uncharacterized protein n=1 Tax=Conger conger TaxID=82655 RepID=A0A9Q1CUP0_CONCO|nr:hypothetical protein COCON_G00230910 [Conger conger]